MAAYTKRYSQLPALALADGFLHVSPMELVCMNGVVTCENCAGVIVDFVTP